MTPRTWIILACIAAAGWTAAGPIALLFVAYVGWIGLLIIGLFILLASVSTDLNRDHPAHLPSAHLMARQYDRLLEKNHEARQARFAERLQRHRLLYVAHTAGIALCLPGLGMFVLHQA